MKTKPSKQAPFWKVKSLAEMTQKEWESLCDGCGVCCLEKIEDEDTGEILRTTVSCEYLDTDSCRCTVYENRATRSSDCILLTPRNLEEIRWLPDTCAYRRLAEGRDLPWWHPLVSGDSDAVHQAGVSVRGTVLSGRFVHPDDLPKYIID